MDKIICLGKNYSDHTLEMKEAQPEKPVLFMKAPSCFVEIKDHARIVLPWHRGNIHHECEVVLKLYKKNVIAVGLGLDLTLRDVQKKLKEAELKVEKIVLGPDGPKGLERADEL